MKKLLSFAAMAAVALSFTAQQANADLVFDLTGVTYDAAGTTTLSLDGAAGTITGVSYDFEIQPIGASWAAELFTTVSGDGGGGTTTGGSASQGGVFDTEFNGSTTGGVATTVAIFNESFLNGAVGAQTWNLDLNDSFDDAGDDGTFGAGGTITIHGIDAIPEPASAALISMIGLGLVARRRR